MSRITASRNPFRTRRLEQLPFRSPRDGGPFDWPAFLAEFQSPGMRERGSVVGPHGSGKTTFLVELKRRLEDQGRDVVMLFTNRESGGRIPSSWVRQLRNTAEQTLVIADGYDAVAAISRFRLRRLLRPRGGLLVTAHRRCALPTVLETRTSPALMKALVSELHDASAESAPPTGELLEQLFGKCNGDLREVFRNLYCLS